jgi:hypothetical protein
MKVLVYGVWDGQSQNIYPFTASYSEMDKVRLVQKNYKHRLILCLLGFSQRKESIPPLK